MFTSGMAIPSRMEQDFKVTRIAWAWPYSYRLFILVLAEGLLVLLTSDLASLDPLRGT